jgi:hypothetical protein
LYVYKLLSFYPYKFYDQLLHKASFYAAACFGYLLWTSSGNHSSKKTQAAYCTSANGKCVHRLAFYNTDPMYTTTKAVQIKIEIEVKYLNIQS